MKQKIGHIISVIRPLIIVVVGAFILLHHNSHRKIIASSPSINEHRFIIADQNQWLNGVALHKDSDLVRWVSSTGERPDVIAVYTRLNQPLPSAEIKTIARMGALPLLQVNPRFTAMSDIAAGKLDAHIMRWARNLHRLHIQVAVSFAHEMNGYWDTWGCTKTSGRLFVKVWRHVHDLIGTHNVIWVWNVNNIWKGSCSMKARYPGNNYVDWVGMDGYLRKKTSTFNSVFASTLDKLRHFIYGKPMLIAETGVPEGPRQADRIRSLYERAPRAGLIGILYFDAVPAKGDYRPQDNPRALSKFKTVIKDVLTLG